MGRTKPGSGALVASPDAHQDLPADPRAAEHLMRWVGVAMFLLGSTTLLATLPLPDPNTSDHAAIEIIAGLLALGAVIVALLRPGRRWVSRFSVVYGILLVSALVAVTRPIEATPFFYLWPLVFSAYFCSRREVAADLVLFWVSLGLALFVWSTDPMKPVLFLGVGVSVTLTTIVVKLLADHVTSVIRQLARAADTDYLTGLLNRRAFDLEFRRQCERARRSELPLAVATFDLDRFKQVNDHLGHAEGDRVLCDFAALLESELRAGDTLARVGGEEFAVVLFGVGMSEAVAFAERIGSGLATSPGAQGATLGTSAGVAELSERTPHPASLMLAADRALYAAKAAGRRRVGVWEDGGTRIAARIAGAGAGGPEQPELVARAL
ncbi:MAG TPA: GGDEF domain-containing protein [Solirubrobacteraceae bacterium]|nr:GGDEF domain-containing protein [Solirubrobacteraceae bacterium]